MKRLVPMLIVAMPIGGCGSSTMETSASAAPMVRLPVVPGRPGAGYFEIAVPADHGALVAVTSPQAERIEMHETMTQGTMTSMRPAARLSPENGRLEFRPGGRHLMLHGIDARLAPGGLAQLVLRFEHGQTRTLEARVTGPGDPDASH